MSHRFLIYLTIWITSMIFQVNADASETSDPMTFSIYESGGNNSTSRWIQASGDIEVDTAEKFREFLGEEKCNLRVFLDSNGGNLFGGIMLGELFRKAGCDTGVGISDPFEDSRFRTQSGGSCMSACVFAFIGGVNREIDSEDLIGVHQHYTEDALVDEASLKFSAVDVSTTQLIDGLLVAYVQKMGVDPILISIASEVRPSDPIRLLPLELLSDINVANSIWRPSKWKLVVSGKGLAATTTQQQAEKGYSVTGLFFCSAADSIESTLLVTIPVDPAQWAVRSLAEGSAIALSLQFVHFSASTRSSSSIGSAASSEISVPRPVYAVRTDSGEGALLMAAIPVTDHILESLSRYGYLQIWPSANVYNGVLSSRLSLSEFGTVAPFVLQHCL